MTIQFFENADYEMNAQFDYLREAFGGDVAAMNAQAAEDGAAQDRYQAVLDAGGTIEEAEAAYWG